MPGVEPRNLRVSDDERSHVLRLLEKATGRGLIDLGEYQERSAVVIAARTRGELNSVLLDLPGLQIGGRDLTDARLATAPNAPDARRMGYSGAPQQAHGPESQVLELVGFGSRSLRGRWVVPRLIVIGGFGSGTKLDFTEATLTSRTVTVEFRNNIGGSADFVLPRGATVRFDRLALRGGHVHNKVPPGGSGVLDLVLTGVKKGGSVSMRVAKRRFGKLH